MTRSTAAIGAGIMIFGLLTGAGGAILVGTALADGGVDHHHHQMSAMMEMTGGAGPGTMMGVGRSLMGEPRTMGPDGWQHHAHHPDANR